MLTREQLRELFMQDGTEQALQEAIENGDLTQEARDRIEAFIVCKDQEQAKLLFQEIMEKDIEPVPTFEKSNEALAGWKEMRNELAQDMLTIQQAKIDTELTIDTLKESIDKYAKDLADLYKEQAEATGHTKEELQKDIDEAMQGLKESQASLIVEKDRLERQTASLQALSFMHAEAKHEVSQARGMVFAEATAPARQAVLNGWQNLTELGKNMTQAIGDAWQHHVNRHQAEKAAMKLDYDGIVGAIKHPVKYLEQKWNSAFAEYHCKQHNRAAEKIRKHEDKLLAMANKKIQKENKSIEFRNKMAKLFGGQQQPLKETFGRADMEKVEEFLKGKGITSLAAAYHKTQLEHAQKDFNHHKGELDKHLGRIKEEMDRRQLAVQQLAQEIKERSARGEFGRHTRTMDDVLRYMEEAQRSATAQTFSNNLSEYAKKNGFESAVEYNTKINDAKVSLMKQGAEHLPEPLQNTWNEMVKGIDRMDQAMVLAIGVEAVRSLDANASIGAVQHNVVDNMINNAAKKGIELDDRAKEAILNVIEKFGPDRAPELCDKLREGWEQQRVTERADQMIGGIMDKAEQIGLTPEALESLQNVLGNRDGGAELSSIELGQIDFALDVIDQLKNGAEFGDVIEMMEMSDATHGSIAGIDEIVEIVQGLEPELGDELKEIIDFDRSEQEQGHTFGDE